LKNFSGNFDAYIAKFADTCNVLIWRRVDTGGHRGTITHNSISTNTGEHKEVNEQLY
jgi:hypothetical protein